MPWAYASWITAVSAFSAIRRGSRKPGKSLPDVTTWSMCFGNQGTLPLPTVLALSPGRLAAARPPVAAWVTALPAGAHVGDHDHGALLVAGLLFGQALSDRKRR